jgi:penicillin-binding protein 1A
LSKPRSSRGWSRLLQLLADCRCRGRARPCGRCHQAYAGERRHSAAEAASADPAEIRLVPPPKQNSIRYFTDWALPQLDTLIEETQAPLDVWTTLDVPMQAAATQSILANTPQGAQGALVALDADGAVRAMVGGRDYVDSLYNRATQAERQPGSAFKLFVYLAALEADYKPEDTVVDAPVTIAGWTPRNSTRGHSGSITLREAFARSVNTVAAKLGDEVGFDTVADMAQRFGITTPINTRPSMVLGSSDVRLIDMTRAFAAGVAAGNRRGALRDHQGRAQRRRHGHRARSSTSMSGRSPACWSRPGWRRR